MGTCSELMILWSEKPFCRPEDSAESLSTVALIPPSILKTYRIVMILRLIILIPFFFYRLTNPVDNAYALWLTSVICEIWFALSWILDQFPKWSPVNRTTYIDRLQARWSLKTSEVLEFFITLWKLKLVCRSDSENWVKFLVFLFFFH